MGSILSQKEPTKKCKQRLKTIQCYIKVNLSYNTFPSSLDWIQILKKVTFLLPKLCRCTFLSMKLCHISLKAAAQPIPMSLAEEITCLVLAELLLYPKDRPKRLNTYTTTQEKLAFLPKWSLTKQYMRRIPPTYGYYTERQCIRLPYCGIDTTVLRFVVVGCLTHIPSFVICMSLFNSNHCSFPNILEVSCSIAHNHWAANCHIVGITNACFYERKMENGATLAPCL